MMRGTEVLVGWLDVSGSLPASRLAFTDSLIVECIGDLAFVERTGLMARGLANSMPLRVE